MIYKICHYFELMLTLTHTKIVIVNYINKKKFKYIHNGTKSIAHHTNIQDFLIKKFKFRKAFCHLHVLYRRDVEVLVNLLYPFRYIISRIDINFFQKLGIVLKQEEIIRKQVNE